MQSIKVYYFIGVFFMFVTSMYPWFVWNNKLQFFSCLFTVLIVLYSITFHKKIFNNISINNIIFLFVLFLAMLYDSRYRNINGKLEYLFLFIVILSLLKLKLEYQKEILLFITKWFAILLLISMCAYIFFLLGIWPISSNIIQYADLYTCNNYYLFVTPYNTIDSEYMRFRSVFLEPGHLTMGLVPLIFANRFDLKNKYVLILFIGEILTFSLAGYIVMFVGYLLLNLNIKNFKRIILCFIILYLLIIILTKIGYADMLDTFLWSRLQFENGTISGDNRVTSEFEVVYNKIINSNFVLFGNSNIDINAFGGISGYKKYIVQYGIFGLILIYFLYLLRFIQYLKYELLVFSLVFIMLLYQNTYPFWYCVLIMYILGISNYRYNLTNKNIV